MIVIHFFGVRYYTPALIVLELIVLFVEAHVIKLLCQLSGIKAMSVSCLMNLTSLAFGVLCCKIVCTIV